MCIITVLLPCIIDMTCFCRLATINHVIYSLNRYKSNLQKLDRLKTSITFSRNSISASDSSSHRSKSGARKRGLRSCLIKRGHHWFSLFFTVILTCRCVDRCTTFPMIHAETQRYIIHEPATGQLCYTINGLLSRRRLHTLAFTASRNSKENSYVLTPLAPCPNAWGEKHKVTIIDIFLLFPTWSITKHC